MPIAIFPGHVGKDSGAIDKTHDFSNDELYSIEAVINAIIATRLHSSLNQMKIPSELYIGSFNKRIKESEKCTFGISLHCDAFKDDNINGYTVFHYPGSTKGHEAAVGLEMELQNILYPTIKSRGIKAEDFYILKETSFPCILLEMGFLTNKSDEMALNNYCTQQKIVHAIISLILKLKL